MALELNYRNKLHEVVREVKKRLVRISVMSGDKVLLLLCNCLYFCVLALEISFASSKCISLTCCLCYTRKLNFKD